jgi:hypothetical protein
MDLAFPERFVLSASLPGTNGLLPPDRPERGQALGGEVVSPKENPEAAMGERMAANSWYIRHGYGPGFARKTDLLRYIAVRQDDD